MSASGLPALWLRRGPLAIMLWPIALLYGSLMKCRAIAYSRGWIKSRATSVPLIVVGNLSVGGTGKTPLCQWLVQHIEALGYRPGIVSRGHRARAHSKARLLDPASDTASEVGDEPLMLARTTGVPVCVCIDRAAAVDHLVRSHGVDIVLSDDGLQHLAMQRTLEWVVVDLARGFGNGWVLPAGPLRENLSRLASVDLMIINGSAESAELQVSRLPGLSRKQAEDVKCLASYSLSLASARDLNNGRLTPLSEFAGQTVHAVAGIGNPQRFFSSLAEIGIEVIGHPMPDHHQYVSKLDQLESLPAGLYEVPVQLQPDKSLVQAIERICDKYLVH